MLDKTSVIPLYAQLAHELKQKILKGDWKEGQKIPAEFELMETYKVSRATVRAAIDELVAQGFLVKKHGIGTFVKKLRPSFSFEPLISLSYALETFGIASKNYVIDKRHIQIDREIAEQARWQNVSTCLYIKRLRYFDEIPILVEESFLHPAISHAFEGKDLTGSIAKIFLSETNAEITKIEQIIEPCDRARVEHHVLSLIDSDSFLCMKRWIYTKDLTETAYYLILFMRGDLDKIRA
ncbi:GntR family transcriptional regulator [Pseudothermotoga sp.]|nr:GntR family transcriptional regulator [Pseudothermotoga sp.]MCX7812567.1 GntR family transcriptional regulator [Pseudothermotoga sp.]MDW8138846.1 GntR family transcriptional regulator [Pseudothermotoga sp.]